MLTIHSVRVAVRGGVVNSEAIAGPRPAPALLARDEARRIAGPTSPSCGSLSSEHCQSDEVQISVARAGKGVRRRTESVALKMLEWS
jgi:hypothetical protein